MQLAEKVSVMDASNQHLVVCIVRYHRVAQTKNGLRNRYFTLDSKLSCIIKLENNVNPIAFCLYFNRDVTNGLN